MSSGRVLASRDAVDCDTECFAATRYEFMPSRRSARIRGAYRYQFSSYLVYVLAMWKAGLGAKMSEKGEELREQ